MCKFTIYLSKKIEKKSNNKDNNYNTIQHSRIVIQIKFQFNYFSIFLKQNKK